MFYMSIVFVFLCFERENRVFMINDVQNSTTALYDEKMQGNWYWYILAYGGFKNNSFIFATIILILLNICLRLPFDLIGFECENCDIYATGRKIYAMRLYYQKIEKMIF